LIVFRIFKYIIFGYLGVPLSEKESVGLSASIFSGNEKDFRYNP